MLTAVKLLCACFVLAAAGHREWRNLAASDKQLYTYEDFVAEFDGGSGRPGSRGIFDANLAAIHKHNAKGLSWTDGVNKYVRLQRLRTLSPCFTDTDLSRLTDLLTCLRLTSPISRAKSSTAATRQ
jgi:hypothetical protein